MSNILLPSNISSNVFRSPTNNETAEASRILTVVPNAEANIESEKRFALITSFIITNKTSGDVSVSSKLTNGISSGHLLYNANIPPGLAFEVIQGNKFIMKEGDSLYVWHDSSSQNVIDVVVSYVIHDPITPYVV